jgi:hypothetical protein
MLIVLAAACRSPSADERAAAEYRGFRDRMCECKTRACADQTAAALEAWDATDAGRNLARQRGAWIDDVERELRACRRRAHD